LTEVALLWTELKERGVLRAERLRALAKLEGVYVPSLYATKVDATQGWKCRQTAHAEAPFPVKRTIVENLNDWPFPDDGPVGGRKRSSTASPSRSRAAARRVPLLPSRHDLSPVRERDPTRSPRPSHAPSEDRLGQVSLTSLSTADYSCISPLIHKVAKELAPQKVSLGVSSLRAYGLEENVLDDMQTVRATGVTFAPRPEARGCATSSTRT